MLRWILWIALALLALALAAVLAGQFGLLKGTPPTDLGVQEGKLKAPSTTPNSVSSQATLWPGNPRSKEAQIAPLALKNADGAATMRALVEVVRSAPGAVLVKEQPGYLYAQFRTPLMKYVDDVEFWLDPSAQVIQVRSASRLGESDLGANRNRIEAIRAHLSKRLATP